MMWVIAICGLILLFASYVVWTENETDVKKFKWDWLVVTFILAVIIFSVLNIVKGGF